MKQKQKIVSILATLAIMATFVIASSALFTHSSLAQPTIGDQTGLTDEQKVIQDIMMTYYLKGMNIQYGSYRRSDFLQPEQITDQNAGYMVCSTFAFNVYYEAFGMEIPHGAARLNKYGRDYYGKSNNPDIVYYTGELSDKLSESVTSFKNDILPKLQVGDVIGYFNISTNSGHVIMVYDIVRDNSNRPTDAIIIHSMSSSNKTLSKITTGLNWNTEEPNKDTGIDEGTVQYTNFSTILNLDSTKKAHIFTVLRPVAIGGGQYNKVTCDNDKINQENCSSVREGYSLTSNSVQRLNYPGIQIEKTVDVFNGSTVLPGSILTYDIAITNNSKSKIYESINIVEDIPIDYVDVVDQDPDDNNQLRGLINSINPGETKNFTYQVKVKTSEDIIGKEIISTGTAAGIPSATIKNMISDELTAEQKAGLKTAFESLKGNYSGAELIDQVYLEVTEKNYNFKDLILGVRYNRDADKDVTKAKNQNCSPYFSATNINALIDTYYGTAPFNVEINPDNEYAKMVLNNYYSAVFTEYSDSVECKTGSITPYLYELHGKGKEGAERTSRSNLVYPETLQDGDVLIYSNTNDPKTKEDGTYAFIYLEDSFYGVNPPAAEKLKDKIEAVNTKKADTLWTLYGKDFFVILRPTLANINLNPAHKDAFDDNVEPIEPDIHDPVSPDDPASPDDPSDDPTTPDDPASPDDPNDDPTTPDDPEIPNTDTGTTDIDTDSPNTGYYTSRQDGSSLCPYPILWVVALASVAGIAVFSKSRHCKKIDFENRD